MKLNLIAIKKTLFLLSLLTIIFSCDKDDIPQKQTTGINTGIEATNSETTRLNDVLTSETITTNFSVTVIDVDQNLISNATIKINNVETLTNTNGSALIENISVNKDFQSIKVNASGYSSTIKTVTPSKNGVTNITITLLKPTFVKTFSAVEGGIVTNNGVSIEFPKDAIANQNGDLYEGEVKTTVTYYNPQSENFVQSMPGTLVGLDNNNSLQSLISKGMIKVDLTDASGNELELFEGKEATIKLPANNNDPATIPFWHLNEEKGLWVQTGTATKSGTQYIAKVRHFSTYNLDVPGETIDLTIVLKDSNNHFLANQKAIVNATSSNGNYSINVKTDNKGEFKINRAPKGADYSGTVITDCENITIPLGIINETATKILKANITSIGFVTLEGTLKDCRNNFISNKVVTIDLKLGNKIEKLTTYTNSKGEYSITKLLCDFNNSTYYTASIIINNGVNNITKQVQFLFDKNYKFLNIILCDEKIEISEEKVFVGNLIINTNQKYQDFISEGYSRVTGYLKISLQQNTDLSGFITLNHVGDYLVIYENDNLINLKGLENLKSTRGLHISGNKSLLSFEEYSNIFIANEGDLTISQNDSLKNLKGLDNLTSVNGNLSIVQNSNLTNIESLINLTTVETLHISGNSMLKSLLGLSNLTSLNAPDNYIDIFRIIGNLNLTDFCPVKELLIENKRIDFHYIYDNAYNPTQQDIIDGNCSQ